jgi:hypothetical protein
VNGQHSEVRKQLEDVIRQATAMRDTLDAGDLPMLADARILRGQAQCAEVLIERGLVAELRATPERTPAQDKASQFYAESDDEVAKWSAA